MDYERKYKEANDKVVARFGTNVAKEIFTDLYESEDEKIRNEIINYFTKGKEYLSLCSIGKDDILAWLEKQNSNVDNANKEYWRGYREGKQEILDKYAELEKQGKSDKIVEKAKTEKQRVLVTESDGSAYIDWDTRSLKDAITLLKYGLNYLQEIEVKKQIMPNSRFGGCSECIPTRFDKEKQGNLSDKAEPKLFHEGEWIISDTVDKDYHICKITGVKDGNYTIE